MKAVSNTTPPRYLIATEQEHLLGQLFEKVFVPVAVQEELTDSRTPETVRRVLALPAWFEVRTVQESQKTRFPSVAVLFFVLGRARHCGEAQ
jgi:predicted nucleic acid-binding protein